MISIIIVIVSMLACIGIGFLIGWLKGYDTGYNKHNDRERKTLVSKMNKWTKEKRYHNKNNR